jgi:hypothetical protein
VRQQTDGASRLAPPSSHHQKETKMNWDRIDVIAGKRDELAANEASVAPGAK